MIERTEQLERLYDEVGPEVWAFVRRRVADAGTAEELFQETFAVAVSDFAAVAAAASARAWMIGIARNLIRRHWHSVQRRRSVALPDDLPANGEPIEDARVNAMRQAIARLPDGQREVLELRLGRELSYAEIAEALAIPLGTVRSRLHHAVASLRAWASRARATQDA
jgi:RNA polymerase sigma-70 factor (ECF subfamily)